MIELADRPHLLLKTSHRVAAVQTRCVKDLQCDDLLQLEMTSPVHDPHTASSQFFQELVLSQPASAHLSWFAGGYRFATTRSCRSCQGNRSRQAFNEDRFITEPLARRRLLGRARHGCQEGIIFALQFSKSVQARRAITQMLRDRGLSSKRNTPETVRQQFIMGGTISGLHRLSLPAQNWNLVCLAHTRCAMT